MDGQLFFLGGLAHVVFEYDLNGGVGYGFRAGVGDVVDSEDTVWDVVLNVDEGEVVCLDEVLGRAPVNVITLGNV